VLVDGNDHQIDVAQMLAAKHDVEVTIIVDIYHVAEYVWRPAHVFHPEDENARKAWVRERLTAILHGKCSQVAAGVRRSATLQGIPKTARKPVDACARYMLNRKQYLKYDTYLAAGFPVGSGVNEGAGRHLVKDRLDISGACWGLETAEAVLQLRALRCSGDFDDYWQFHLKQEHARNHAAQYKDGAPPDPESPDQTRSKPLQRMVPT
jgi:hypothetical protein